MILANRRILLGVTGGVAAYKAAELVRRLQDTGAVVDVAMTAAATRFVGTATFQALSGRPVWTDAWDTRVDNGMAHIELGRAADLLLIAPCSADFLAKLAHGLCDDLLSTLCVARNRPLAVAPAMNREMWANPATRRNVGQLRTDGLQFIGPDSGDQACGETGEGRMVEPDQIVEAVVAFFTPKRLAGRRVLITAGPTYEPIDPVRGVTNRSSGKMGFAIAQACARAGAQTRLVAGPCALPTPGGVHRTDVVTARDMYAAVIAECDQWRPHVFISVAAVADWGIAEPAAHKLKKDADASVPVITFSANPDILATVAARADAPYCVGFAAESENLLEHGQAKRQRKQVPLLVANIGPDTFGMDDNELLLIDANGTLSIPRASKSELAAELITEIAKRL